MLHMQLVDGASPEDRERLHLSRPQDYHYLNQSSCTTLPGVDNAEEYRVCTHGSCLEEFFGYRKMRGWPCLLHCGVRRVSSREYSIFAMPLSLQRTLLAMTRVGIPPEDQVTPEIEVRNT
jgi:hypothetical protein